MADPDALVVFLRARLDEEEQWARDEIGGHIARWDPARTLATVAVLRRMIDMAAGYWAAWDGEHGCNHSAEQIIANECPETRGYLDTDEDLQALAALWSAHPDYRQEWRP